jgi:Protein of unknown function (DUF3467)
LAVATDLRVALPWCRLYVEAVNEPQKSPLNAELHVTVAYGATPPPSTFSNFVSINTTGEEILLDFCELSIEAAKADGSTVEVAAFPRQRIVLTPQHALRFVAVLNGVLSNLTNLQAGAMVVAPPLKK